MKTGRITQWRIAAAAAVLILSMVFMTGCGAKVEIPDEYNYDDYSEFITLGNYKGVEYPVADSQVSDAEVKEYINGVVADSGTSSQNKTGTVKADSVINIDYIGRLDGEAFDGGSATDVELDIADNNYIPGFAEGIIGHKAGETFDLVVTFPENYGNEDLAGKETVFETTINYIVEEEIPEYNDEWVKNNTEYSSMKEYEDSVRADMLAGRQSQSQSNQRLSVFNSILASTEVVKYPEKELNVRIDKITTSYKDYAAANEMEFAEYLEEEMGITEDDFNALAKQTAEDEVKKELVLYAIASQEEIKITPDEYNDYLIGLLEDAGYTEESYKEDKGYTIQEYATENGLYLTCLYQKVMDKVMEYSVGK